MKRLSMFTPAALAMLGLGIALSVGDALGEEPKRSAQAAPAKTWLSFSGYVGRPEGCAAATPASASDGVWWFASANGRTSARFIGLASMRAVEVIPEVSAYLSADVVRADGSRDPAFGHGPRDMVIEAGGDGRITLRFVDFASPKFNGGFESVPAER